MAGLKRPPQILTINVISDCNSTCIYCHCWRTKGSAPKLSSVINIIKQAYELGVTVVRISGGEPLIRTDIASIVKAIRDDGMVSMVCTSGRDKESLKQLAEVGLDIFAISIDTTNPEQFRKLRGYEVAPVLDNLKLLTELRAIHNFEIVISVVVTRINLDYLDGLFDLVAKLDLLLSITPVQYSDPLLPEIKKFAFERSDRYRIEGAVEKIKTTVVCKGVRLINSESFLDGFAGFLSERCLPKGYACYAGNTGGIVTVEGRLKLCHSLEPLGGEPLRKLWTSKKAEGIRKRMEKLDCPLCWLSCHADNRNPAIIKYGRTDIWSAL